MKIDAFWQSAKVLLHYKTTLAWALLGALISAATFGAGLGMLLPVLHLLLEKQNTLHSLLNEYVAPPGAAAWRFDMAGWLAPMLPTDHFYGFIFVIAVIMVLSVVGTLGTILHEAMALSASFRAVMHWRARMFRRMIHAPLVQMLERGSAQQISRLFTDTYSLAAGYSALLGRSIGELLRGAAALAVALLLNWKLTIFALILLPVILVLLRRFGKTIRRATRNVLQEHGRMLEAVGESLRGLRVVKANNAEGFERRRFNVINRKIYQEQLRARMAKTVSSPLMKTMAHIVLSAIATFAAWLIFERNVKPEQFMAVLAALGGAAASIKPLTSLSVVLHEANAAAERVLELAELPVEPGTRLEAGLKAMPRHQRDIVFDGVSYTYPGQDTPALRHVSLRVEHGQTVAIVGGNGSGKTTLLSLLPRLLEPSAGRVLIDGVDIRAVRVRSLRNGLGVVTQRAILFTGSIADNIAYGRRHVAREKIIAAAKAAYAHDFIEATPHGYDTVLGEDGAGLSGGQQQRLCIARAMLRKPAIMILDEATSQIDTDSEAKINQALRDLRHDHTTFVIAHRLSTVIDADMIVVMDAGQILDKGTHDELLERCETYRLLTQTQLRPASRAADVAEVS